MPKTYVQPYIFFAGNCAEAVAFYTQALGAEANVMTYKGTPMESPDNADRVMHATLSIGDAQFYAADSMPGAPIDTGMRAQVSLGTDDVELGRKYINALAAGGEITMPYEKQFWGDTFGTVTDRFGVKWMVNASPSRS